MRVRPVAASSMNACAVLLTMLLASTPLVAEPLAPYSPEAAESAALVTVALICASDFAPSVRSPPELTAVLRM